MMGVDVSASPKWAALVGGLKKQAALVPQASSAALV